VRTNRNQTLILEQATKARSVWGVCGWLLLCGLVALAAIPGCRATPTLKEQEQLVRDNKLMLDQVTTRAVVNVWGKPPYHHSEFTHFFVMPDRSLIPSSRVIRGETPKGWDAGVHAGEGVFFAYPDHGWLLVFLDEQLVYREELKPDELQALVKAWAYEDRFKTRLDGTVTIP
jgi:hypothetical protein